MGVASTPSSRCGLALHPKRRPDDVFANGVVDNYWQLQNFVAVQYVAFQQLYIKLVGGYARGHWIVSDDESRHHL